MKKKFVVFLLAGGILSSQLYFSPDAITRVYASEQQLLLSITGQPQNQSVAENSTVVFKVTASGNGLKYQWQWSKSTTGGWTDTTLTGCKTSTLSVLAESFRNGMYYRCVVTDQNGKLLISNVAKLTILKTDEWELPIM